MEGEILIETVPCEPSNPELKFNESTENFQKFIHDLFEKNGIMSDVRAYLRGHIVNVLKSSEKGSSVSCQKNFQQRLNLKYQAMNLLIAEYLVQLEFTYTLSVFVSEIPLANMVFEFAKSLFNKNSDTDLSSLKFCEKDVWSILNNIGLKCDSEYAKNLMEIYKTEEYSPLLLCIIQTASLCKNNFTNYSTGDVSESLTSSFNSDSSVSQKRHHYRGNHAKCRHASSCKLCKKHLAPLKEKYRDKKKQKETMFQQIKSVYETELAMVKAEEEKKIRKSIALHALYLKKKTIELEETYQSRVSDLESSIREKKQFLVSLARTLKEQHTHLANAMSAVKDESRRLNDKEENLKSQLDEAEEVLRKRGEEMRTQISVELQILEKHLETMKKERETIEKERSELEKLKINDESKIKVTNIDSCEEVQRYDILKNELKILRGYLESSKVEPKCLIERGTLTDLNDVTSRIGSVLNNEQGLDERASVVKLAPNKVVNDFKKKNVNFPLSPTVGEVSTSHLVQLTENNNALLDVARQQRQEIEALRIEQVRLERELTSRRFQNVTNSRLEPFYVTMQRAANAPPTPYGAGEQVSALPRDTQRGGEPFVQLPNSNEGRRYLINQWRTLRKISPDIYGNATNDRIVCNRSPLPEESPTNKKESREQRSSEMASGSHFNELANQPTTASKASDVVKIREKKTKLKDLKDSLKYQPKNPTLSSCERSSKQILKEAKLRLRRLEIEAEAVEKSYLDFRRRQIDKKEKDGVQFLKGPLTTKFTTPIVEVRRSKSLNKVEADSINDTDRQNQVYEKYIDIHSMFRKKTATKRIVKPIPLVFSDVAKEQEKTDNYLETPINEFRKLYNSQHSRTNEAKVINVFGTNQHNRESIKMHTEIIETDSKSNYHNDKDKISEPKSDNTKYVSEITKEYGNIVKRVKTPDADYTIVVENNSNLFEIANSAIDVCEEWNEPNALDDDKGNDSTNSKSEKIDVHKDRKLKNGNGIKLEHTSENCLVLEIESSIEPDVIKIESVPSDWTTNINELPQPITIVVSPKKASKSDSEIAKSKREKGSELKDYITDISQETNSNDASNKGQYDYPDDFSADVDNFVSDGNKSPISLPRTDEENFWDS